MKRINLLICFLLIPCLCFASNYSLNLHLKDIHSNPIDFSKVKIQILDKNGNIQNEILPNSNIVNINLNFDEYNIVTSIKNQDNKTTILKSNYIKLFQDSNLNNMSIIVDNTISNNVSFLITNLPADWTQAKLTLKKAQISTFKMEDEYIDMIINVNNKKAIHTLNTFPTGVYNYSISRPDGSEAFFSNKNLYVKNNSTLSLQYKWVKKPTFTFNFKLVNNNGSYSSFTDDIISLTIKDIENKEIYSNSFNATGNEVSKVINNLNQGSYTLIANVTNSLGTSKNIIRKFNVYNLDRSLNINLNKVEQANITFSFVDSRSSKPIDAKLTITNINNNQVLTSENTNEVSNKLLVNIPYKINISSNGYETRTFNFIPKEDIKKEINLRQIIK